MAAQKRTSPQSTRPSSTGSPTVSPMQLPLTGAPWHQHQTPFLMWYDDDPKTTPLQRVRAAMAAYRTRLGGTEPTVVLVNRTDGSVLPPVVDGVPVRVATTVQPNTYWVGQQGGFSTSDGVHVGDESVVAP